MHFVAASLLNGAQDIGRTHVRDTPDGKARRLPITGQSFADHSQFRVPQSFSSLKKRVAIAD